jgi:hypothetical protein
VGVLNGAGGGFATRPYNGIILEMFKSRRFMGLFTQGRQPTSRLV